MTQALWTAVDDYFNQHLLPSDPILAATLAHSEANGLPPIHVAPNQGKLLHLLALASKARRILEVGTLGGYSTIWMARALPPDGRLVTLEYSPLHARVARENFERAGLADRIEVRVGAGLDSLAQLQAEGVEPFDMVFIDADKPNNARYFQAALKLSRAGTLIIVDNVVREGDVLEAASADERVIGVRRLVEAVASEPRVTATALQTVGDKGYDGFMLMVVR